MAKNLKDMLIELSLLNLLVYLIITNNACTEVYNPVCFQHSAGYDLMSLEGRYWYDGEYTVVFDVIGTDIALEIKQFSVDYSRFYYLRGKLTGNVYRDGDSTIEFINNEVKLTIDNYKLRLRK